MANPPTPPSIDAPQAPRMHATGASQAEVKTHDEEAFQQQEGEHGGSLIYWIVGLVLAVVTILEVFAAGLWFSSSIMIILLVAMAVFKGAFIIAVFMHMQGDAGVFKFVFFAPFVIASLFMGAFLLLFSTHVGIAG